MLQIRFSFIHSYACIMLLFNYFKRIYCRLSTVLLEHVLPVLFFCTLLIERNWDWTYKKTLLTEHRVPSRGAAKLLKALRESITFGHHPLSNSLKLLLSQTWCFGVLHLHVDLCMCSALFRNLCNVLVRVDHGEMGSQDL